MATTVSTPEQDAAVFPEAEENQAEDSIFGKDGGKGFLDDSDEPDYVESPLQVPRDEVDDETVDGEPMPKEVPEGGEPKPKEEPGEDDKPKEKDEQKPEDKPKEEEIDPNDIEALALKEGGALLAEFNKLYDEAGKPKPAETQPAAQPKAGETQPAAEAPPAGTPSAKGGTVDENYQVQVTPDDYKSLFDPQVPAIDISQLDAETQAYFKEYPQDANAVMKVAGSVAKQMVGNVMTNLFKVFDAYSQQVAKFVDSKVAGSVSSKADNARVATKDDLRAVARDILDFMKFQRKVVKMHPDVDDVVESDAYKEFLGKDGEKLKPEIKALLNSRNVRHADLFLKLVKKTIAGQAAAKTDKQIGDKKKAAVVQLKQGGTKKTAFAGAAGPGGFNAAFSDDSPLED